MVAFRLQPLYRIISLDGFLNLIYSGEERYTKPLCWDDTFEGCGLRYVTSLDHFDKFIKVLCLQYKDDINVPVIETVFYNYAKAENINNLSYGQCWSTCKDSDALWRIYSYDNKSIQIESSSEALENIMNNTDYYCRISRVKYDVCDDDKNDSFIRYYERGTRFDDQFFHKRAAFKHEEEVRLIIKNGDYYRLFRTRLNNLRKEYSKPIYLKQDNSVESIIKTACRVIRKCWDESSSDKYTYLHINDISKYIKSVQVHPFAEDSYVKLIETICEKNNIHFAGKSTLYGEIYE